MSRRIIDCSVISRVIKDKNGKTDVEVCLTCPRCKHTETGYGVFTRAVLWALTGFKVFCPKKEKNIYAVADIKLPGDVIKPKGAKRS